MERTAGTFLLWGLFGSLGLFDVCELQAQATSHPRQKIEEFHEQLLTVMRMSGGFEVRRAALSPLVHDLFDVATISRISLGRSWKTLDERAKRTFIELLESLIVATYASRFDQYSGQTFRSISTERTPRGWVVKTELLLSDGEQVRLDYYLREGHVYNIVAEGVSDLSLRRADYNSIIKLEGYDALIAHISKNIEELNPSNE
ncbi:MAG: ABC transporter substrate-binding protein [Gammaproteobacteria bacterium]|nr:ABC transporter substrate-binding protein [Gammaproteobacteria bacterium]